MTRGGHAGTAPRRPAARALASRGGRRPRLVPVMRPECPAERVDAREEPLQQAVGALRALDLGTWPQPSSTTCSALGSQRSTWWRKRSGISRSWRPRRTARAAAASRAAGRTCAGDLEVDRAGAREERQPRAGRAVDALELVDDDVGDARVHEVAVGEQRPERPLDPVAAERVRQHPELGAGEAHEPVPVAPHERDGGAEQRDAADAVRAARGRPRSRRGRPCCCRRCGRARCSSASIVPITARAAYGAP